MNAELMSQGLREAIAGRALLRFADVGRILGIGRSAIYLACQRGDLVAVGAGARGRRITADSIVEYYKKRTGQP